MVSINSSNPNARRPEPQAENAQSIDSGVSSDIFISYSRKDKDFVATLNTALKQLNRDPWVDWDDIQKGEEWWKAIQRGIETANTVIFVISPDSVASPVCQDEVNYAAECNKRFLPIVRREGFDAKQLHPAIASHNWLFFRETDDFQSAFQELLKALDTDLDYVREHTRLLVRAIEWQNKERNPSYLLRGSDLARAEEWLMQGVNKKPKVTQLQSDYIKSSHDAEEAIIKARQRAKRTVILTTLLVNLALVTGASIWLYSAATALATNWVKRELATAFRVGTVTINGDEFKALIDPTNRNEADKKQLYQRHQEALVKINTVIPKAFPRSFVYGSGNEIYWVGDVSRSIETPTGIVTQLGQPYTVDPAQQWLLRGLNEPATVTGIYRDNLGNWLSISGPIKNSNGEVVGGLRIDFTGTYVREIQERVRHVLFIVYVVVAIWLIVLSAIILRATQIPGEPSAKGDRLSPAQKKS